LSWGECSPSSLCCLHYTGHRYALFSELFQFGYFPELYNRTSVDGETVSPIQTTLLKLLDSFLHSVPTPFPDRDDRLRTLADFLASAFLLQAEYVQSAIQRTIGEPLHGQNSPSDLRESSGTAAQVTDGVLDGRLPGVWVTLVLLSTSLSSILLGERGADTAPDVVTVTRDAISGTRSRTGAGFIEELSGTMVPWFAS
jgi:ataxin-10